MSIIWGRVGKELLFLDSSRESRREKVVRSLYYRGEHTKPPKNFLLTLRSEGGSFGPDIRLSLPIQNEGGRWGGFLSERMTFKLRKMVYS